MKRLATRAATGALSDPFWQRVEPLLPAAPATGAGGPGGSGRRRKDPRLVFEAIVHVLRTGCPWKALPRGRFGSASAIHQRYLEWERAGVFTTLWRLGLAESAELRGVPWRWHDGEAAPGAPRNWQPAVVRRRRRA